MRLRGPETSTQLKVWYSRIFQVLAVLNLHSILPTPIFHVSAVFNLGINGKRRHWFPQLKRFGGARLILASEISFIAFRLLHVYSIILLDLCISVFLKVTGNLGFMNVNGRCASSNLQFLAMPCSCQLRCF
jgi:hypothetical protein